MNQSEFLEITWNSLEAREKSRGHGVIGFAFASHWLKNWRESFTPITKRSNRNHVITFDSQNCSNHVKLEHLHYSLFPWTPMKLIFTEVLFQFHVIRPVQS